MKPKRPFNLAVLIVAGTLLGLFALLDDWKRDLTTNHAKLDDASSDPMLRPFVLPMSPQDAAAQVEQWVDASPRWDLVSRETMEQGMVLHLTRRTKIMRFVDDLHIRLLPTADGTRVEAESQSRVGVGDLGQNPRNLRELRHGLKP